MIEDYLGLGSFKMRWYKQSKKIVCSKQKT